MRDHEESIGFLVNDVSRALRRTFNRRVQEFGLSQAQWQTLAHLSRQEGVNQVTLAESLEIQPITLVRLIDRLQDAGLVVRRPDPEDRRAVRLYLTSKATPLLEVMNSVALEIFEDAMVGITEKNRRELMETLNQIKKNLLNADAPSAANSNMNKVAPHAKTNA